MITTAVIHLMVPTAIGIGKWAWTHLQRLDPLGIEKVYNPCELEDVLRTYGRIAKEMVRPWETETFLLLACADDEHAVGRLTYRWDSRVSEFYPEGDPWVTL